MKESYVNFLSDGHENYLNDNPDSKVVYLVRRNLFAAVFVWASYGDHRDDQAIASNEDSLPLKLTLAST